MSDDLTHLENELELQKALVAEAQAMTAKVCAENEALRAVVEAYEKNGVTCQTFRHFVDSPCAECNVTAMKEKP